MKILLLLSMTLFVSCVTCKTKLSNRDTMLDNMTNRSTIR